jgi:hypothetical protein
MVPKQGPTRPTSPALANYKASSSRALTDHRSRSTRRRRRHRSGLGAGDQDLHACLRGGGAPREGQVQGVGLRRHRAASALVHVRRLRLPPLVRLQRPRRRRGPRCPPCWGRPRLPGTRPFV